MSDSVLLVDFENVGKIDLAALPDGVRVPFFVGAAQKSIAKELVKGALKLGERFELIEIEASGKNALDFHIAFYLGEQCARSPGNRCIVLSKDKGFDPLIKHLVRRGFQVRRAATVSEAFPRSTPNASVTSTAEPPQWDAVLRWLGATQKNKRPRKRKALVAHLYNRYAKKITEADLQAFVDRLIASKKLSESRGSLTYHF